MMTLAVIGDNHPLTEFICEGLLARGYGIKGLSEVVDGVVFSAWTWQEASSVIQTLPENLPTNARQWILLSSPAVYGEGQGHCGDCGVIEPVRRVDDHLAARRWEPLCPYCMEMLMPQALSEAKACFPVSDLGKFQLAWEMQLQAEAVKRDIPLAILRCFQPYWPSDSYLNASGHHMVATFTQKLLTNEPINLYEDGNQLRDITYGSDVLKAIELILQRSAGVSGCFNIATGQRISLYEIVAYLQTFFGKTDQEYTLLEQFRDGDARHRFADISLAQQVLGYQPDYGIVEGLKAYVEAMCALERPTHQTTPTPV
jgi:dTDP-L-rhamnose 4-epimerase